MHSNTTANPKKDCSGTNEARRKVHAMWAGVAGAWEANAAFIDARGRGVSERMLELASPRPGERMLELACGVGGPGLQAAPLLVPGGEVVVSDVSAEMTAFAAERAAEFGLENVSARTLDLEEIEEPDASFDIVICREGLMLTGDTSRALAEIRRVLRPGGRLVFSVWGPRSENPWLSVVFDAVSEQLEMQVPPPGVPHPFSLEDRGRLYSLVDTADFAELTVEDLPTPYLAADAEEWWQRTCELAGPLTKKLNGLPADVAAALRSRATDAIAPYETPSGLEIPGLSRIISGTRPTKASAL